MLYEDSRGRLFHAEDLNRYNSLELERMGMRVRRDMNMFGIER